MNKTVRNERRKLSATYVNGIAMALMALGGFTPVIAFMQTGNFSVNTVMMVGVCFLGSGALHSLGRRILGGLEE
jgi:hypothetical protein